MAHARDPTWHRRLAQARLIKPKEENAQIRLSSRCMALGCRSDCPPIRLGGTNFKGAPSTGLNLRQAKRRPGPVLIKDFGRDQAQGQRQEKCGPRGSPSRTLRGTRRCLSFSELPPWPNGQGVGLLIRRLRVRVPQGVLFAIANKECFMQKR